MSKPLSQIVKTRPQVTSKLPNQAGYTPHKREVAQKDLLRILKIADYGYPYDNKDAHTAADIETAVRPAGKPNVDTNNIKMAMTVGDTGLSKEEADALQELSKKTLRRYIGKAGQDIADTKGEWLGRALKRSKGIKSAVKKVAGASKVNATEETEPKKKVLDELSRKTLHSYKLKARADIRKEIPYGNSPKIQKRNAGLSLAMKKAYGDKGAKVHANEETINELSKKLLDRYAKKADADYVAGNKKRLGGIAKATQKIIGRDIKVKATEETINELSRKRLGGYISKAMKHIADTQKAWPPKEPDKKYWKRVKGANQAANRIGGRRVDKHGKSVKYNAEETEISELSKKTVRDYLGYSQANTRDIDKAMPSGERSKGLRTQYNRRKLGQDNAVRKLTGRAKVAATEETEITEATCKTCHGAKTITKNDHKVKCPTCSGTGLSEHLAKNASVKSYIHDFVHSKNNRFKDDSKKERIHRALGAWYSKAEEYMDEALTPLPNKTNNRFSSIHWNLMKKRAADKVKSQTVNPPEKQNATMEKESVNEMSDDKAVKYIRAAQTSRAGAKKDFHQTKFRDIIFRGKGQKELKTVAKRDAGLRTAVAKRTGEAKVATTKEENIAELSATVLRSYRDTAERKLFKDKGKLRQRATGINRAEDRMAGKRKRRFGASQHDVPYHG
jgi:hypothetical protein